MRPTSSILSDANPNLINAYLSIKEDWPKVFRHLRKHHRSHSPEYYYQVRSMKPTSTAGQAARFIYLNRTCWNGLYRVNRTGEFNVPVGTKKKVILDSDDFERVSEILVGSNIRHCDFSESIEMAQHGDFVFVDPPYTIKHNYNGFIKYNESLFSWDDQVRLKDCVQSAVARGAKVLVTNACHKSIRDLYRGVGDIIKVSRSSVIAGNASARGRYEELIIRCY